MPCSRRSASWRWADEGLLTWARTLNIEWKNVILYGEIKIDPANLA